MFKLSLYQLEVDGRLKLWRAFTCSSLSRANKLIAMYKAIEMNTMEYEEYKLYWEITAM